MMSIMRSIMWVYHSTYIDCNSHLGLVLLTSNRRWKAAILPSTITWIFQVTTNSIRGRIIKHIIFAKCKARNYLDRVWTRTIIAVAVINDLCMDIKNTSCPVIVNVSVKHSLVCIHHFLIVISYDHLFSKVEFCLIWYITPASSMLSIWLIIITEECYVSSEWKVFHVRVLPYQHPSSSIQCNFQFTINLQYISLSTIVLNSRD